ncbi:MAG: HlyD family type I secretion periplasmic adaptor subunit [Cyanobacteria bacterium P01_H01_bin.26]
MLKQLNHTQTSTKPQTPDLVETGATTATPKQSQPGSFDSPVAKSTTPSTSDITNWSESLQATLDHPPAALPRYMVLIGVIFACMFGTWMWFGTMQEVSRAQGELVPEGDTYKVQPVAAGEVSEILVQEGDTITAGQVVIELDTKVLTSEVERLSQNLIALNSQLQQTQILIDQTRYEADAQQAIATAEIQTQESAIFEAQANMGTHQAIAAQLTVDLAANESRLNRLQSLVDEGAISTEYLFDVEQTLRDRQRVMTERQGQVQQSLAQAEQMHAQLELKKAEATSRALEAREKLKRLHLEADDLEAQIAETTTLLTVAQTNLEQMFLHAPVNGTVSSVHIGNIGEVAQPGETMVEIAPAQTPLVLSAMLPIREAGLVEPDMVVQMKFDAFPYQEYGIVPGRVTSISPDAKQDKQMGAVYNVEIALERDYVIHEDESIAFKAGQTANAEIIIRKRRIVDFLLAPIRQLKKSPLNV